MTTCAPSHVHSHIVNKASKRVSTLKLESRNGDVFNVRAMDMHSSGHGVVLPTTDLPLSELQSHTVRAIRSCYNCEKSHPRRQFPLWMAVDFSFSQHKISKEIRIFLEFIILTV